MRWLTGLQGVLHADAGSSDVIVDGASSRKQSADHRHEPAHQQNVRDESPGVYRRRRWSAVRPTVRHHR